MQVFRSRVSPELAINYLEMLAFVVGVNQNKAQPHSISGILFC